MRSDGMHGFFDKLDDSVGHGITLDLVDVDGTDVFHHVVQDGEDVVTTGAEFDTLDWHGGGPGVHVLAVVDGPHLDAVVGAAGDSALRVAVDIDRPDGTGVALQGAETLAVDRVPDTGDVIFGTGEHQVTLTVVLDLREGTLVAHQHNRSHLDWVLAVWGR